MKSNIDFRMNILVVDDHPVMRRMLRFYLKEIGFKNILDAGDGKAALLLLQKKKFGLVVTDWNMPKISGLELLEKIRSKQETKNIPVLMITAEYIEENVIKAIKAGADHYIVKPFTAITLEEKIDQVFSKKSRVEK